MNNRKNRSAASVLAVLAFAGLTGCGGGSSQIAQPVTPAAQNLTVPVAFANGQAGALTFALKSATSGTLTVAAVPTAAAVRSAAVAHAATVTVPVGSYLVTGTFTPPNGFRVAGAFPPPFGAFVLSGTVPASSQPGAFTLTFNGQTYTGTVPIVPTTAPTPTPMPNPTPNPTPSSGLTISASTANSSLLQNGAFTGTATASKSPGGTNPNGTTYDGQYNVDVAKTGADLSVELFTLSVSKGQKFPANDPNFHSDMLATATGRFDCDDGTVTVTDISNTSITLLLTNVHYAASPGGASGSFTVNGTVTAPIAP